MLKEFLREAVSLVTEAVVGRPIKAAAGCPYTETRDRYDACWSCGAYRKWHYYEERVCDPCFGWCTPWRGIYSDCVVCT